MGGERILGSQHCTTDHNTRQDDVTKVRVITYKMAEFAESEKQKHVSISIQLFKRSPTSFFDIPAHRLIQFTYFPSFMFKWNPQLPSFTEFHFSYFASETHLLKGWELKDRLGRWRLNEDTLVSFREDEQRAGVWDGLGLLWNVELGHAARTGAGCRHRFGFRLFVFFLFLLLFVIVLILV